MEIKSCKVPITGEVLQAYAIKIWNTVKAARKGTFINPPPTFSLKWLALFKEKHNIKRKIFYREVRFI